MAFHISPINSNPRPMQLTTKQPTPKSTQAGIRSGTDPRSAFAAMLGVLSASKTAAVVPTSTTPSPVLSPVPSTAVSPALSQAPQPAPTAESVFGANPWLSNPTGQNPDGTTTAYNPIYFATAQTAAQVAQMVGGKVVETNAFTGSGGPFAQQQPNQMVQLANGALINPGLVASFYTHGYSQSFVNQMVANEVKNSMT